MSNVLAKENIVLGLDSVSREESIVLAGKKLVERGYVNEGYVDAMLEREKTMSTNMGLGFAIPHGVNEAKKDIKESGIVILQFPNGVEYGNSRVYLVIGIAGKGNEHLDILSKIAISLDDELVNKLKDSTNAEDFLNIFAE